MRPHAITWIARAYGCPADRLRRSTLMHSEAHAAMFNLLHFILLISPIFYTFVASEDTVVNTPSGRIKGQVVSHNGILVQKFVGIPFVKPPLGELRFKRPVAVEPWNATLEAKALPPGCPQYSPSPFPWLDDAPGLSEDCLYLNVWAPVTARHTKKSVMFWIHGGGFRISSSRLDFYQGQVLAAEGDVIVVTTNFRLGALGFFYSGTEDAPGNMGMLDLVESLKWVRRNIESFGGDIDSITLFGQSAGGIAIGMFCVSPLTRGLFRRAILQSGSPTNLDGQDNDRSFEISKKLVEAVGCSKDGTTLKNDPKIVVQCMRGVDATELAVQLSKVTANNPRSYYLRFGDELLPTNPRIAIIKGHFQPVDVLIGSNSGDGATLITKSMKDVFGFFGEKDPQINITFGESIIREMFKNYPDPEAVVKQYLSEVDEADYEGIRFEVFTASGDYSRVCPSVYFAERFAKKNTRVYYYFYIHRPSVTPWAPWMLAVHHDETPFIFGYPLRYSQNYCLEDQVLSKRMILAWSSFAKTGHPQPGLWPLYSKENPFYQTLDTKDVGIGYGPHRDNCDFFRSNFGF